MSTTAARASRATHAPARASRIQRDRARSTLSRRSRAAASASDTAASLGIDGGAYARELGDAVDVGGVGGTRGRGGQARLRGRDEEGGRKEVGSVGTRADEAAQAMMVWDARWRATMGMAATMDA